MPKHLLSWRKDRYHGWKDKSGLFQIVERGTVSSVVLMARYPEGCIAEVRAYDIAEAKDIADQFARRLLACYGPEATNA